MKARYEKIEENDQGKQRIRQVKREVLKEAQMEPEDSSKRSTRSKEDVEVFSSNCKKYSIELQQLPTTDAKITYFKAEPGFVLACLKDFIDQAYKNKETFIEGFILDVVPVAYNMTLEEKEISLKLDF